MSCRSLHCNCRPLLSVHFVVTFEAAAKLNALNSFYTEVLVKPFHIVFDVSGVNVSILMEEKFGAFL